MTFIQHTFTWLKGEIFEASIIAGAGIVVLLCGLAFWKFGNTSGAKAFIIPTSAFGVLLLSSGLHSISKNRARLQEYEIQSKADPVAFAVSEKKRVESFKPIFQGTKWMAVTFFLLALAAHFFTESYHLRAIGTVLAIIGISGLVIDYFAKERADIYYQAILNQEANMTLETSQ